MAWVVLLFVAGGVAFGVDQLAKRAASRRQRVARPARRRAISFEAVRARACVGAHDGRSATALWMLVAVFAVVTTSRFADGPLLPVALGLALGGAASNLVDGLRTGSVVDHLRIGVGRRFNVADATIVVGTLAGSIGLARVALAAAG